MKKRPKPNPPRPVKSLVTGDRYELDGKRFVFIGQVHHQSRAGSSREKPIRSVALPDGKFVTHEGMTLVTLTPKQPNQRQVVLPDEGTDQ